MKHQSQRGVALIITLVMLSVVTLTAITFLAVSRRERAAVTVTEDSTSARLMADAGLERAKVELVSRMMARGSLLEYDMTVTTNFVSSVGFDSSLPSGVPNVTNVNYDRRVDGGPVSSLNDRLRNIGNLMLDPRAPVYVRTNQSLAAPLDFRFFLDLNRNGRFETNGLQFVRGPNNELLDSEARPTGDPAEAITAHLAGDPEWIGVLENQDLPHSGDNRFQGRYAYVVLPANRNLDFNFIHNNAVRRNLSTLGYHRDQGVGSWELNLAAFLRDLNTNVVRTYTYNGFRRPQSGEAYQHALGMLRFRYDGSYATLLPASAWFGPRGDSFLRDDYIDMYADGPPSLGYNLPRADRDPTAEPWVGSDNPEAYFDLNDLYDPAKVPPVWLARMMQAGGLQSTYDRYTFYRMLGQIGTDSSPGDEDRIHINYDNVSTNRGSASDPIWVRNDVTNLVEWTPERFFHATADRLLSAAQIKQVTFATDGSPITNSILGSRFVRPGFSLTNIMVWPTNEYSATVHRLLKVAVNLYDATTNRADTPYPHLPTVLRPTLYRAGSGTNQAIYISGYREVLDANAILNISPTNIVHLDDPARRNVVSTDPLNSRVYLVYDLPLLIGAKKGLPNFNEVALQNFAQLSRKAELKKLIATDPRPAQTNLMYLLTVTNRFGVELWNSYTNDFNRRVRMVVRGSFQAWLTNTSYNGLTLLPRTNLAFNVSRRLDNWTEREFVLPIFTNIAVVSNGVYSPLPRPTILANEGVASTYLPDLGFYMPQIELVSSNRFYCALVDETVSPNRLLDFVCLGNLGTYMNVSREVSGRQNTLLSSLSASEPPDMWLTNRVDGVPSDDSRVPMQGALNQIEVSLGNIEVSEQQWTSYSLTTVEGDDKNKSIDRFRMFCGLTPLVYRSAEQSRRLASEVFGQNGMQAPFSPTRKLFQDVSWQANDPLVHFVMADLLDPYNRPDDPNRTNSIQFVVPPDAIVTNWNLGRLNTRYRPWGGNPRQSTDRLSFDSRVKDAMIERSDDWEFPTNKFPNIGWLGRVHRGTPWQTLYLKSGIVRTNDWWRWAGAFGTHPTNDWRLVGAFTAAPNDNATRGLISVNQTNLAAWSALLGGVTVFTNTVANTSGGEPEFEERFVEPNSPQLRAIVAGINRTREQETNLVTGGQGVARFETLGRVLATPQLTDASPYINTNNVLSDFIQERIPQQVLSLLREDGPRFVIYSFGQALKEAPNSVYLGEQGFYQMCTNYQVKAETATRTVLRIEGPISNPRAVVESYNEVSID